jgi:hypothetical protein
MMARREPGFNSAAAEETGALEAFGSTAELVSGAGGAVLPRDKFALREVTSCARATSGRDNRQIARIAIVGSTGTSVTLF